jgi:uncharacterized coiled-coil DUF342 family protein
VLDLQNTNKEIGKTFKEIEKLHKEKKCLDEKIVEWMRGRFSYSEYPIYQYSEYPIYI